ncbi:PREDICTED: uncharacterized protein LOC107344436, partial [Acropora digitifera]|uniref:uncharacterized protein LOC107344436 n=1 Tax=Acropora digitifera TaxID=70779 RepID=UPI00077ADD78
MDHLGMLKELSPPNTWNIEQNVIKLLISAPDLNEDQSKEFDSILSLQVKTYVEVHDHSTDKLKEVGALNKFITEHYRLLFKYVDVGSLVIVLNCQRIESIEHLWNDFLSGHLDKVAERYLVTDEIKKRLNLETINLKTTIEKENYLNCRKALMDCSGEPESTLFSQQGVLDQETKNLIKLLISATDLSKEQLKKVHTMLSGQVKSYLEVHDHSKDKGVRALAKFITKNYGLLIKDIAAGSLIIVLNCQRKEILEHLWHDYLSGHLDKVAERYLVTDEMKRRLTLETITLKTTIEEENYLNCRKVLMDCSGEADRTLFSQQDDLDQEISMIGKATVGSEEEVIKQEDTDWMFRMKKARASRSALHKASVDGQYEELNLRTLGRRAFTSRDEHSGFNLLQAAVLEGDDDTVTKASVHLENFVEEMNCRTTGEKASIFPGKSAADIWSAVKGRIGIHSSTSISEIFKEFVEFKKTLTRLHSCAKGNDVEMAIELVLNDGIDVNVARLRDITPLVWASPAASSLSIKTLIDLGADVNAQTFYYRPFDLYSGTALDLATHGNNANVVKVLLANKADPNIADQQGNTVLHSSTSTGFFNISQLLVDSGCKVNGRNNNGETSLHSAVRGNNVADVKLLLRNNADVNIENHQGNTPLHISACEGLCDISQLLVDCGCKINARNEVRDTPLH